MKLLGTYKNGNYITSIFNDGTKIRTTNDDEFIAAFPENIDCKITNYCDKGCPMCHENSTVNGKHGDILNIKFIKSLHPYTEMAIGGGDPLSHPELIPFLEILTTRKVIANITINQTHFMQQQNLIKKLVDNDLIKGLGVSLANPDEEFVALIQQYPNAVIHVINGMVEQQQFEQLCDKDLKILILGYKTFGRGRDYFKAKDNVIGFNQDWLYQNLPELINRFKVVSFDNLAIKQLDVQKLMSPKEWERFYMGDDGQHTMYIDLVEQKFAKNSTSTQRYDLKDNIVDMFNVVKSE